MEPPPPPPPRIFHPADWSESRAIGAAAPTACTLASRERLTGGVQAAVREADVQMRTIALLNLAAIIERADEQVLPAVYLYIARSLKATPTQLGTVALCRCKQTT